MEDNHIFVRNMPFISSSEEKNAYFMSGKTMNVTLFPGMAFIEISAALKGN